MDILRGVVAGDCHSLFVSEEFACRRSRRGVPELIVQNGGPRGSAGAAGDVQDEVERLLNTVRSFSRQFNFRVLSCDRVKIASLPSAIDRGVPDGALLTTDTVMKAIERGSLCLSLLRSSQ